MGSFMKKLWNDWGPLFVALLIAIGIICAIHYTDYPEKWFRHDMSCDGSIGVAVLVQMNQTVYCAILKIVSV